MITFDKNAFLQGISDRVDQSAHDIGKAVVKEAMLNTAGGRLGLHLRTGELHGSISYAYDNNSHAINFIVGAPYGAFVEYGTRRSRAFPFMRAALNSVKTIFGFETSMEFGAYETDRELLAGGSRYVAGKGLTAGQKRHVKYELKPTMLRHHIGNVSRAEQRFKTVKRKKKF